MRHFILLPLFLFALKSFSQQKEKKQNTVDLTKVTILEPGIAHEFSIGRNQTVFARVGIAGTFDNNDPYGGVTLGKILFRAFVAGSFRAYYNFEKRQLKEKKTDRNSANYFALLTVLYTKPFNRPKYDMRLNTRIIDAGLVWGLQRNFSSRFSIDFNIGGGYEKFASEGRLIFLGEFNIGFWLGKKTDK